MLTEQQKKTLFEYHQALSNLIMFDIYHYENKTLSIKLFDLKICFIENIKPLADEVLLDLRNEIEQEKSSERNPIFYRKFEL